MRDDVLFDGYLCSTFTTTYSRLITSMEVDVLHQVDEGDYFGDTWVLLRHVENGYGFLCYGWGSCSGCDAAEAVDDLAGAVELRDQLWGQIHWEPDTSAMFAWLSDRDWEGQYFWHDTAFGTQFLPKALEIMGQLVTAPGR